MAIQVNTFTDANPSFPYQSSETRRHFRIPDSPAIHLAITQLAQRLLAMPISTDESNEIIRVTALRCASYGVLMNQSFEAVELRFNGYLDLPSDQATFDRATKAEPIDWLSQAIARVETEGIAVASGVRQQATPYGWRDGLDPFPRTV